MSDEEQSWPRVIKLAHPFAHPLDPDEMVTSLKFRRGKAGDIKGLVLRDDRIAVSDLMLIASRMCAQEIQVIEQLDGEDFGEVLAIARDFFVLCLSAGKT